MEYYTNSKIYPNIVAGSMLSECADNIILYYRIADISHFT